MPFHEHDDVCTNGSSANGMETNGYTSHESNGHSNGTSSAASLKAVAAAGGTDARQTFLRSVFEVILKEAVVKGTSAETKVVKFEHPAALEKILDLELKDKGESDQRLLELCKETIDYSVKTGHPRFFNQLYSGLDQYGLAGCWLTDSVNTSQYTFEVAPVFTLMEQAVLKRMRDLVGYLQGDGIFCPGGSISNMYGLNLARFRAFPQVKAEGMQALPKICLFTSDQSHYSIKKGAAVLGMGINCIRLVPCDERGKMIPSELDRMITEAKQEEVVPLFVNATAGTTVIGAYDPLGDIADVCERHGVWMHVDCCWGGGALMSRKHKHLMAGINRADSVAWNPHKMMGTPLQCCAFLTRHLNLLQECHSANAQYLFQQDKFYDISYDTGDKSIQCGRKVDVFKIWLMWKARGNDGFEAGINRAFENSEHFMNMISNREGFEVVFKEPECTNVCFWYIPRRLRNQPRDEAWWQQLSKVAPAIKERMVVEGTMLIGYNPLGSLVNFFRMVVSNLDITHEDMEFAVEEIERLGETV